MHVLEHNLDVIEPISSLVLNLQLGSTIVASRYVELAYLLTREGIEALFAVTHYLRDGKDNGLVDKYTVLIAHNLSSDVRLQALSL